MTSLKATSRNLLLLTVLSLLLTNLWAVFPQSFEGGDIPAGWTVYNLDGDGNQFNAHNAGANAYDGDWIVRVNENLHGNNDWLVTPALTITNANRIVNFYAKSNNATLLEDFNIKLSTTTNEAAAFTVNIAQHTNIPATWTKYTADLSAYVGQTVFLGIQCVSVNKMQFQLDAFDWQLLYDLEAVSLAGPTAVFQGTQYTYTANIKNNGAFTESNYTVKLYDSNHTELASASGVAINPEQTLSVELNWTPVSTGAVSVYARLIYNDDQVSANDTSNSLSIIVYNPPAPAVSQVINSYSTGQVICSNTAGGLVAVNSGTVTGSFWDTTTSGQINSAGGEGKTSDEMKNESPVNNIYLNAGWSFKGVTANPVWNIGNSRNGGYPYLSWEFPDDDATLPVTLSAFTATYTASNTVSIAWTTQSESNLIGYHVLRAESNSLNSAMRISNNIITAYNQPETSHYSYTDNETEPNATYYYWLQSAEYDGTMEFFGPVSVNTQIITDDNPVIPLVTQLNSAYPNPFNPSTTISFDIAEKAFVSLEIYNIKGQRVRTLVNADVNPGSHRVVWNGLDENHRPVSSGVYFYKMQAGKYLQINKIVMMK